MSIRNYLRDMALRVGATVGVYGTALTSITDVRNQISSLRPLATDMIRLGPPGDGGYLIPNDLEGVKYCFSPGVSNESGFELDCANAGLEVFMADASVAGPAQQHNNFHFIPKFIGSVSDGKFVTLDGWIDQCLGSQPAGDGILQMDIEGYEYETLLTLSPQRLSGFRIVVVEFHHLHLMWSCPYFQIMKATFDKLLNTHACVHIHPNNFLGALELKGICIPQVMEFTFWRKDRIRSTGYRSDFPHPLDSDNYGTRRLQLPKCWY